MIFPQNFEKAEKFGFRFFYYRNPAREPRNKLEEAVFSEFFA